MTQAYRPPPERTAPATVTVIGAGYVGLVTAAGLASLGHRVTAVDKDPARVRSLRAGAVPIMEHGLAPLLLKARSAGRLRFEFEADAAAAASDIVMIAVGTLDRAGAWTGRTLVAALEGLLQARQLPRTLVIRSTLQPGFSGQLGALIAGSGRDVDLLLHPEFSRQGSAVRDFLNPDRIVIGVAPDAGPEAAEPVLRLYRGFSGPVLIVDYPTAELIKIGSNAFLALKVAFANELAWFCRSVGADMAEVRHGLGLDGRIGPAFLRPGPGIGGSCLPSQVELLARSLAESGLEAHLMKAVAKATRRQPARVAEAILELPGVRRVAVLGLAFKAGTDDLRGSPAVTLLRILKERGVPELAAYDPTVRVMPSLPWLRVAKDPYAAAMGADVAVIATEWPEFGDLDWLRLGRSMKGREIFDARGIVSPDAARAAGLHLHSLERRTVNGQVPDEVAADSAA